MAGDPIAAAKKSSESWYWWGIPTFFRCPWNEDPAAADIALVGVPHSKPACATSRPSTSVSTPLRMKERN